MNQKELHRKVSRLKELIDQGHIRFERPSAITESFAKIRYRKNGQVDPDSVDENVHALLTVVERY
ncbi:hypothetical protein [Paludifilum halophilum]|uniref:Uncharacterized protein n=1 Tax=Paludifilum halophilum TaxID=1642702 RepID=A0A235B9S7_9BACL|nr:hypothetical protein [Paludifilum halophilum]OYD09044.1 hypothetical protein CHM34_04545 [Paludifilum halophilum]